MSEYLTIEDLCKRLKIGKYKAYKLVEQPDFPKIKIGNCFRIPEDKLEIYLNHKIFKEIVL